MNSIYPAPNSPKTAVKSAANFAMRMVSSILAIVFWRIFGLFALLGAFPKGADMQHRCQTEIML